MSIYFFGRLFVIASSLLASALFALTPTPLPKVEGLVIMSSSSPRPLGEDLGEGLQPAQNLTPAQIIDSVISRAGGENWARPKTLCLRGSATFYFQGKADNAIELPVYKMWRVYPDKSLAAHQANGKVRFDALYRAKGAIQGNTSQDSLYFQVSFDGKTTKQYYSPLAEPQREASLWENNFGFGILRFARDTAFRLVRMADDQFEGHDCYLIRIIDAKQSSTDFGIDKSTFAIRYVGFKTPRGFHHRTYSDFAWHDKPRFLQPRRVKLFYDGVKWTDIVWKEFEVNKPIADSVFSEFSALGR
ncbi:MAG: outer membrane lipoprotein-sorting protein [Candidatus Kapabacteria bacterium]|jgi:hypothetical protein|nr:outer membrane lipoprotein-sorting protein [Candidatus Kapabacteria bacterium]